MFGYIAINKPEMKFKDYDVYQSYYCGLCERLKALYGRSGQITLSYDMTFLIILLSGLYEPSESTTEGRCIAHPFKKHQARINEFTDYAADMNLILFYFKCKDDWADEKKKLGMVGTKILSSDIQRLQKKYPEKFDGIASCLNKISDLEKVNTEDIDQISGLFGHVMALIFDYKNDIWEDSLKRFGFFLGKFIYLMDAYEDIESDLEAGLYNPFHSLYKKDDFENYSRSLLRMMMAECSREFEKLPILLHAEILRNILYSGVWCRFEAINQKRNSKSGDNTND